MATVLVQTTAKYGFADGKLCFQTDVAFVLFCFDFFLENVVTQSTPKTRLSGKRRERTP